jgi:glucosamine--fructose-6-phosphate aminotransferase (isomerizing)
MKSLKRIEYRGYDSAGIAVMGDGGRIQSRRVKGGVDELQARLSHDGLPKSHLAIGHTRWATHGVPSEQNAHPHSSTHFALVHNGIIENYQHIRRVLEKEGFKSYTSDTDTEVLVWLIERNYQKTGDVKRALAASLKAVQGTFGLAILCKNTPGKLYLARRGSPLVIGHSGKSIHVASDVAALVAAVKEVSYLEDDQIAVVEDSGVQIFNLDHERQDIAIQALEISHDEATKGGYEHFLIKEIHEQPQSAGETLRGRLDPRTPLGGFAGKEELIRRLDRIIGIGCGTAYYAGLLSSYLLEDICDVPMQVEMASEFLYRKTALPASTTLALAISQSGETADTISAIQKLKEEGIHTHGVVNVIGSSLSRITDTGTYLYAGPEISVASTKAFTSQVIAQMLIGIHLNQIRGNRVDGNEQLRSALKQLPEEIAEALEGLPKQVEAVAEIVQAAPHVMFLGRHTLYPVAMEGALKLKEVAYIQTEGHPAGEMKHGPLALIDDKVVVIFLIQKGILGEKSVSNLEEVRARGGRVVVVTDDLHVAKQYPKESILIHSSHPLTAPLLFNVPLQLLAYYVARAKKLPIDKPRNLAKSVTVE